MWFSSAYILIVLVMSIPSSMLLEARGVKCSLAIAGAFLVVGAWLRVLINTSFTFAFVGQYLASCSYPFLLNSATKISAHWFTPTHVIPLHDSACVLHISHSNHINDILHIKPHLPCHGS